MINRKLASNKSYFLVWLVALSPIIGSIIQTVLSLFLNIQFSSLFFITVTLNILLVIYDAQNLKKENLYSTKMGMPVLIPVYLFKRSKILCQSPVYALTWCAIIFLIIITPSWKLSGMIGGFFGFY